MIPDVGMLAVFCLILIALILLLTELIPNDMIRWTGVEPPVPDIDRTIKSELNEHLDGNP